jgi:hypothetical protein
MYLCVPKRLELNNNLSFVATAGGVMPPPSYSTNIGDYTYRGDYDPNTTYDKLDIVRFKIEEDEDSNNTYDKWFYSFVDSNTGNSPTGASSYYWGELSVENQTAMLDPFVNTSTAIENGVLKIKITTKLIDTFYFHNVKAKRVYLQCTSNNFINIYGSSSVYIDLAEDFSAFDPNVEMNAFLYQRSGYFYIGDAIELDNEVDYTIIFTNGTDTTSTGSIGVGELTIGKMINLGETQYPIRVGLSNISLADTDDNGVTTDTTQITYKDIDYEAKVQDSKIDAIVRILEGIKGKKCLYTPQQLTGDITNIAYGKFENVSFDTEHPIQTTMSLSVKGVV